MAPRLLHRTFYGTRKASQTQASVKPVAFADPVVTTEGVLIKWQEGERRWTPAELKMLADWAYALSSQTTELAQQGLIGPDRPYDFAADKAASAGVDK